MEMLADTRAMSIAACGRMRPASEWALTRKKCLLPTKDRFFIWAGIGMLGLEETGNILFQDDSGLYIVAHKDMTTRLRDQIVQDLLTDLGDRTATCSAIDFWTDFLGKRERVDGASVGVRFTKDNNYPLMQINTMHKRKGVKVEPVDNSGQKPRQVAGNIDWKAKAIALQVPNADLDRAPFRQYFEPRYANFPRNHRLTPERVAEMKISPDLLVREREMLLELLCRREAALAWDFKESGRVSHDVMPPATIDTVPHKAWQVPQFPVPRKLRDTVIKMVQARIDRGTLELCKSQYRNPYFLVAKKDRDYRLINNAQKMNKVTIRDANPPPNPDELAEEFAGCCIMSLVDFFSGYDQIELDVRSRDITAFYTPLGLVRQCTLPMGATNSVAEFVRCMTKICRDHIPGRCMPYLDDICIKGPKTEYQLQEVEPGFADTYSSIWKIWTKCWQMWSAPARQFRGTSQTFATAR